ncbi:hypothetical protein [Nocardioides sp.]|uniref:hypothetical protein n=1 Tax=Nocardioides sp. TaxID=35761 RepID=UPI002CC38AB5|nr:hypothetical protein [Nocardioides sp.]HXH78096.1 hypothetical protein [Nocardioides sp.]
MTEFRREEGAFRNALAKHASEAPALAALNRSARRRREVAVITAAVASVVVGAFLVVPALVGGQDSPDPSVAESTTVVDESEWKWIGLHAVEVRAPARWDFGREVVRPDCIDPDDPNDPWAEGVPTAPYVTVTPVQRASPMIGCTAPRPGNPDPAFGDLPLPLWQPHVRLDVAVPDASQLPDRVDGQWTHQGWRLSRRTYDDVQISVLTSPDAADIAEQVFDSARTVETNHVGCQTSSPFTAGFPQPDGDPVPPAVDVQSIAVCDYSRISGAEWLQGSWRMTGQQAQDLAAAIVASPAGQGPDEPQNCSPDMFGDSAVVLRFFDADDSLLADAYVYTQWCFGNGIVTSSGSHMLTAKNCPPIFSRPEVTWWGGQAQVMRVCRQ